LAAKLPRRTRFIRLNDSGESVKRICLLGAAIAGLFIIGVATALAAAPHASTTAAGGPKKSTRPTTITTPMSCTSKLSLQVATGDTSVTQGATDGTQSGSAKCGQPLGSGVEAESFTTDDAGNITGKWQQYFNTGTVFGVFTLVPNDQGPPTTTSFSSSSYTGTITIKSGTGTDKSSTGTGTLACATTDAVHFTCTEKVTLIQPAPVVKTKSKHGGG
jgi:hypothetical protein